MSMSIVVTLEEIKFYRSELTDHRAALDALQVIEDCDGDLEDAAISLAIRSGQEPDTNERWIEGLAKRWRHVLCGADLKDGLEDGISGRVIDVIVEHTELPTRLAVPVAIYVIKTGVPNFCQPLEEKIA
jgi:putative heme iron utilization protein